MKRECQVTKNVHCQKAQNALWAFLLFSQSSSFSRHYLILSFSYLENFVSSPVTFSLLSLAQQSKASASASTLSEDGETSGGINKVSFPCESHMHCLVHPILSSIFRWEPLYQHVYQFPRTLSVLYWVTCPPLKQSLAPAYCLTLPHWPRVWWKRKRFCLTTPSVPEGKGYRTDMK